MFKKVLTAVLVCLPVLAQAQPANQQTFTRVRDATNPNAQATVDHPTAADIAPAGVYALDVTGFGHCLSGVNWTQMACDANGDLTVNQTTTTPGYTRLQDGDSTVLQDVEDTLSDGLATTLNGAIGISVLYLFNGATLDKAKSGAVGELLVTDVVTRPGEDAGRGVREIAKVSSDPYERAPQVSGSVGTAAVVVLDAIHVANYPNCCLYLHNDDGVDPFTDANIYTNAQGGGTCGDGTWVELAWVACDGLLHDETCVYCFSNLSYGYICAAVEAVDANPVSSVTANLICNPN